MLAVALRPLRIWAVALAILLDSLRLNWLERFARPEAVERAAQGLYRRAGTRLRKAAVRQQGLIIKLGQFLSARADVLPEAFTRELARLQDEVPAAPFAPVRRQLEADLGRPLPEVFDHFEETAVAAASLGQVHRARLKDGGPVAVKVLRPGIEQVVRADLTAVRLVIWFLQRWSRWGRRLDLDALYKEFAAMVAQEMDYIQEVGFLRRFRQDFAGYLAITAPAPVDQLTSRRLLVMEFVEGEKLTEPDRLRQQGIAPRAVAERLVDAYVRMVLVSGVVHVDPHPGNLFVRADGTLIFIDFGMVAVISKADKDAIADMVLRLITRDLDGTIDAIERLGFLRPGADREVLRRGLAFLLDQVSGLRLQMGPELDRLLQDLRRLMSEGAFQFPARYMFLARAAGLLAGITYALDPTLDWSKLLRDRAMPLLVGTRASAGDRSSEASTGLLGLIENLFGERAGAAATLAWDQARGIGGSLIRLPGKLERTLDRLETGDVRVQTDLSPLLRQMRRQEQAMARLSWAVLAAGGTVAGALLVLGGRPDLARWAWWGGAGALVFLLLGFLRGGRGGGRGTRFR